MPIQTDINKLNESKQNQLCLNKRQNLEGLFEYDRDHFPPNMEMARIHGRATRCAKVVEFGPQVICRCCGLNANNKTLKVCHHRKDLSFLGTGFPLLFEFANWTKIILILAIIIYGIYAMLSNAAGRDCINSQNLAQIEMQAQCCSVNSSGNTECFNNRIISETFCQNLIRNQQASLVDICASSKSDQNLNECCQQTCIQNDQRCQNVGIHAICLPNKQNQQLSRIVQSIMLICFVIIFKVIMLMMRRQQKQTEFDSDKNMIKPSDFTAIIRNLPSNQYDEQSLRHAIEGYCKALNLQIKVEIVRIILSYEVHEYVEIVRQLNYHNLQIEKANYYFKHRGKYPGQISQKQFVIHQQQISILSQKKEQLDQMILQNKFKKPSTLAFVTFKSKNELDQILSKAQISPLKYYLQQFIHMIRLNKLQTGFLFQGNLLSFERAPEPDDVFWENCGIPNKTKVYRRFVTFFMASGVIIVSLGLVLVLKFAQQKKINQKVSDNFSSQKDITILSLLITLMIVVSNKAVGTVINKYSLKEYHTTRTNYYITTTRQVIFFQFVNSALIIIAADILFEAIYFQNINILSNWGYINRTAFQRNGGIIDDLFQIKTQNCVGPPLINYLNPRNWINLLKKRNIRGRIDHQESLTTQAEVNRICEGKEISLIGLYSYIISTIWIAFFYASLVPLALIVSLLGIVLHYWVQKVLFSQVYTRPFPIGNELNKSMLDMLQYSTIFMALGSIIFDFIFKQNFGSIVQILNFVALIISLTEFVFTGDKLFNQIFFDEISKYQKFETFETSQQDLITDYDRLNPITKESALESYLEKIYNIQKDDHTSQEQKIITGLNKYSKNGGLANHNFNFTHYLWTQEIQKYNQDESIPQEKCLTTNDNCNFAQSQVISTQPQSKQISILFLIYQLVQKFEIQDQPSKDLQVQLLRDVKHQY